MQYVPPLNGDLENPDRPYVDADPAFSIQGSIPSGKALEAPMRELLALIAEAGIEPDGEDLTQVRQAVAAIAAAAAAAAAAALVDSAPGALDTLAELAAALGNDADFAVTVTNALAGKVAKSGDTMTGALAIALAGLQTSLRHSDNTADTVVEHMRYLRGSGAGARAAWRSLRGASNAVGDLYLTFLSAADAVLQQYTFGADGKLLLPADPTAALGAATKQYVDSAVRRRSVKGPYATTSGGTLNEAHGLSWVPAKATTNLICKVNNNGFTVGQRAPLHKYFTTTSVEYGPEVWWDAANFGYLFGWGGFLIWDRSGSGNFVTGNPAHWDFEILLEE